MATRADGWSEAHRLVVHEGWSYTDAANATGIPISTLQKRAANEDWQGSRSTQMSYAAQIRSLKSGLLTKALAAMETDPAAAAQLVYAWKQAEATYPEHRYGTQKDDPKVRLAIGVELLDELVTFLGKVDRELLTRLTPRLPDFAKALEARLGA